MGLLNKYRLKDWPWLFKTATQSLTMARKTIARRPYSVTAMVTNRCNSKCRTCNIWQYKDYDDLPVTLFENLVHRSQSIDHSTHFCLSGGEFFQHPEWEGFVETLKGRPYFLCTSGLYPKKAIEAVEKYKTNHINISLDGGNAESYKKVRGINIFDRVCDLVLELKKMKVRVVLNYVANPFNTADDYEEVKALSKKWDVELATSVYNNPDYFQTTESMQAIDIKPDRYNPFVQNYHLWEQKKIKVPCWSVRSQAIIMPHGSLRLCVVKELDYGNLHEKSFDDIWLSQETEELQNQYIHCQDCWMQCNKPVDLVLMKLAKSTLPSSIRNKKLGAGWTWDVVD